MVRFQRSNGALVDPDFASMAHPETGDTEITLGDILTLQGERSIVFVAYVFAREGVGR